MGVLALLLAGCAQGHCRRPQDTQATVSPVESLPAASPSPDGDRVFVYKYDGSQQCKKGTALSLDAMAKQLAGVVIFSSVKKNDGMMHIQACGSITGMANVYEISTNDLKKAEDRGFKKWAFE